VNQMQITATEWLSFAVAVIGLLFGWLSRWGRLPKTAREWLKKIGEDRILSAIEQAQEFKDLTAAEKRAKVVEALQRTIEQELGLTVPTSILNLLVEFVYQKIKR